MQNHFRFGRQMTNFAFFVSVFLGAMLLSLSVAAPTFAQDEEPAEPAPTEEPAGVTRNDPLWVQFTAARRAIEQERGVDLTFVQQYRYAQSEFVAGIDAGCDGSVEENDVRPVYFGFTWTITDLGGTTHQARTSILPGNELVVAVCDEVVIEAPAAACVNINTATAANLQTIVHVDAEVAAEIIAARPFTAVSGLSEVEGLTAEQVTAIAAEGIACVTSPSTGGIVTGSGATGAFELGGHVDGLGPNTVQFMNQSGMTWVKKQLRFTGPGSIGLAQEFINDAQGKGFKILLGIVGEPSQMSNFDAYITEFANFVGQVAALGPDAIEVWNEPNIAREWPQGQISGANYTRLLRPAYEAIKAANPNVIVISGAPAPTGAEAAFPGQVVNDDNFMRQMRDAGAGNYFDCLGLHYNEGIVSPTQSSGDPRDNFPTRYFGTMLARGANIFPERPVCWTELGYLSGEGMGQPIPAAFNWAQNVTVAQHAQWLAEAAQLSAQSGRVRMMIVWNVNFTRFDNDPMGGYAMIRPDGTCPSCALLGAVMGN